MTRTSQRAKQRKRRPTDKWVSPIGQTHAQFVREQLKRDPAFRAEWERTRPYQEIATIAILRRTDLGLSQEQVARRMGTTKSVVSRIESGRHPVSLRTLKRLAEALDLQLVVGFEDSSTKRPKRSLVAV